MNNQWRPQQPLYAQQTGFNPQLQPQATGYPSFIATQPTGFAQSSSFSQPQPQHPANALLNPQQQSRFLSTSPVQGALAPQQTGWAGAGGLSPGGLVPQMTGFAQNPQMAMMSSALMPSNVASLPQFQSTITPGTSLQQSIQQHNLSNRGSSTQNISWALSKDERKSYDQIFRAWDSKSTGFISGSIALEVFGQSGLPQDDLAKIWELADSTNRGSLNLPEFHVAMGLIYRRLNGTVIPESLPPELIPPSERDLDSSVNFLKDILSKDSHERATNGSSSTPTYAKSRSLYDSSPSGGAARKDGSAYVFNDSDVKGYRSNSRHVDRKTVRYGGESAVDDLSEMKRQLQNTAFKLDKDADEAASRTEEDEQLDEEMDDVKYRVRRVQEDLDRVSRGPRSAVKDEERRRLERELLHLMHDRLPELERRVEQRDQRKKEEKESWARERNRRNDRTYTPSRYDGRDRYDRDQEEERGYMRGSYDRDERDRDRDYRRHDRKDSYERERERDRYDRDREYDRVRTPPTSARSPPPAPNPTVSSTRSPAPAPKPSSPAPAATPTSSTIAKTKNMTPEERAAFIRAEAQRRMKERMTALGVNSPAPSSPSGSDAVVDAGVEERLVQERIEAEEKAKKAEREAEEREAARRARLEEAKGIKSPPAAPAAVPKPTPPTVKSRAPAPPPPIRHGSKGAPPPPPIKRTAVIPSPAVPPPPPQAPKQLEEGDEEEKEFKRRQEALRARNERLKQLEEEARLQEEEFEKRRRTRLEREEKEQRDREQRDREQREKEQREREQREREQREREHREKELRDQELRDKQRSQIPSSAPTAAAQTSASPPPPPPPPPVASSGSTNPFHLMTQQKGTPGATGTPSSNGTAAPAAGGGGGFNPFFNRQQQPAAAASPAPVAQSAPRAPVYRPQAADTDDEWDTPKDKEGFESDSSDESDEYASRTKMGNIAETIFGKGGGVSRPTSAGPLSQPNRAGSVPPGATRETKSAFVVPSAPPPPAPVQPPMGMSGVPPPPPPPPPDASTAPIITPAAGDRSALLGSIQAGARLRKAVTNDRSGASVTGRVVGGVDPQPAASTTFSPVVMQPPPASQSTSYAEPESHAMTGGTGGETSRSSDYRQSVDWYAGLAADGGVPRMEIMDSVKEEDDGAVSRGVPEIQVTGTENGDGLEDVDFGRRIMVRTLYAYEGQRSEDLSFAENLIINAYPSKSGDVWWYGTLVKDGNKGFFPNTYIQEVEKVRARAKYAYDALNADEMTCSEGQPVDIIDQSDPDWWKTEKNGVVLVVPASYMEIVDVGRVEAEDTQENARNLTSDSPINPNDQITGSRATPTHRPAPPPPSLPMQQLATSSTDQDASNDEARSQLPEQNEGYFSFDESDTDSEYLGSIETHASENQARALERQRVLEAAGLRMIVNDDPTPRARPKRRPAPLVPPDRSSKASSSFTAYSDVQSQSSLQDLPQSTPMSPVNSILRLEDAYDRYEAFKNQRMSLSLDTSVSTPISPATTLAPSAISYSSSLSGSLAESRHVSGSGFLHSLFGRSTTPNPPQGDGKFGGSGLKAGGVTISGPIPLGTDKITAPEAIERENSPVFGASWSSLVDKDVLEGIPTAERRRQEAIFELINTEIAYVRDVQLIVEVFYSSMLPLLDQRATTVIFANIEDILLCNTAFLSSLEERQKDCRLYVDNIGDILQAHMPNMAVYMPYCVNQSPATKILQSIRQENQEVASHLNRLRDENPNVRNLDLSSYLLAPMQRITRYPLLLKQILVHTSVDEEYQRIKRTIQTAESILDSINESIREREGMERLSEISKDLFIGQGRLDLTAPTRNMGRRKLLKEGTLTKAKSGRKLQAFLCSDILVLTDSSARSLYRMPIPLSELKLTHGRDGTTFRLVISSTRGGETVALRAASAKECQTWVKDISTAIDASLAADKRSSRRSRHSRGSSFGG
ncbi:hypothetical protein FRC03_008886 [Tulasnella sp. 419]|nr:hypothetical protein FRC03_008886 [Tulasnella sp. 419]